jgi:hypothetical protein
MEVNRNASPTYICKEEDREELFLSDKDPDLEFCSLVQHQSFGAPIEPEETDFILNHPIPDGIKEWELTNEELSYHFVRPGHYMDEGDSHWRFMPTKPIYNDSKVKVSNTSVISTGFLEEKSSDNNKQKILLMIPLTYQN